jgi:hypothetical protein
MHLKIQILEGNLEKLSEKMLEGQSLSWTGLIKRVKSRRNHLLQLKLKRFEVSSLVLKRI